MSKCLKLAVGGTLKCRDRDKLACGYNYPKRVPKYRERCCQALKCILRQWQGFFTLYGFRAILLRRAVSSISMEYAQEQVQ